MTDQSSPTAENEPLTASERTDLAIFIGRHSRGSGVAQRVLTEMVERIIAARIAATKAEALRDVTSALTAAFSGDEFAENANAAVGDGELSWFRWLATSTVDALIRPGVSGSSDE